MSDTSVRAASHYIACVCLNSNNKAVRKENTCIAQVFSFQTALSFFITTLTLRRVIAFFQP